jgi:uncharacterized protein with ParB-like and HNH nuclease domain
VKIRSIDRDINDILKSGFYRIPRFQRPYSWDRENIEDFWNDVVVNADADYFIGSMVVYKPDHSDVSFIVDGQQRLTTIIMILAALRNAFRKNGSNDLALGIHALIERPDINNQSQYSLQTETSYPYFQEHIQKNSHPEAPPNVGEEEEALKATFTYFTQDINSTVAGIIADRTIPAKVARARVDEKLSAIRNKLLALKVIYIDLDNEDDAYLIFETMNTRGKDLAPSDLVKSHLTKLLKPTNKNVDLAKDAWNKMVDIIEGSQADLSVTTYLHHYWLSRYEYVTVKKLYKDLKKKVKKQDAKSFLDTLVADARIYREIQETSYRKWEKSEWQIKESLEALNVIFRLKQPMPMLLAIMHAYDAKKLKLGQVQDILSAIENFHFVFTAITSQRSSGGISFMYALHARNLLRATDTNEKMKVLSELKKKLKDKLPPYEEFVANFTAVSYSKHYTKRKQLVQYVLAKLDRYETSGAAINYSQMTIEHLASQSGDLKPSQVANIGNLLLCEKDFNSNKLAAKTFAEKKILLKNSKVTMDTTVKKATSWGAKEIDARAKAMAKVAFDKVWKM